MKLLLVEPKFPIPAKSKNHKDFLPIGLLKIASYQKSIGNKVIILRGNLDKKLIIKKLKFSSPDEIWVTTLFTYWSEYVKESVQHYRSLFPKSKIIVGGVYATLMPEHCKKNTGCNEIFNGTINEVEEYTANNKLDYSLLRLHNSKKLDYQIVHSSRGCFRECEFCGTWKVEPVIKNKISIKKEICSNRVVFYDNQMFTNPHLKELLQELAILKYKGKPIRYESQSGFDARLLTPEYAKLIKSARFDDMRIAWDWGLEMGSTIKKALDMLVEAGYKSDEIYVFMIYNWLIDFETMEKKRTECWNLKTQIADCRFRPLDQTFDKYNSQVKNQNRDHYYIHPNWTDAQIRQFRRNVRKQNICVRMGFPFHSNTLERMRVSKKKYKEFKKMTRKQIKKMLPDAWFPDEIIIPRNITVPIESNDKRPMEYCNVHPKKEKPYVEI